MRAISYLALGVMLPVITFASPQEREQTYDPAIRTAIGKTYTQGRSILIAAGFAPSRYYEAHEGKPFEDQGFPEAGTCRGNCVTTFLSPDGTCWDVLVNLTDMITSDNEGVIESIDPSSDCDPSKVVADTSEVVEPPDLISLHAEQIESLGFDRETLESTLYLQRDTFNPPSRFVSFEAYLAALYENPKLSSVSSIESGDGAIGIRWKLKGLPAGGVLFHFEDGEAHPASYLDGDHALAIADKRESYVITMTLLSLVAPAVHSR